MFRKFYIILRLAYGYQKTWMSPFTFYVMFSCKIPVITRTNFSCYLLQDMWYCPRLLRFQLVRALLHLFPDFQLPLLLLFVGSHLPINLPFASVRPQFPLFPPNRCVCCDGKMRTLSSACADQIFIGFPVEVTYSLAPKFQRVSEVLLVLPITSTIHFRCRAPLVKVFVVHVGNLLL